MHELLHQGDYGAGRRLHLPLHAVRRAPDVPVSL